MHDNERKSKIAMVTGASGAIGTAISTRLAADGFEVIGLCRGTKKSEVAAWKEKLESRGHFIESDISNHARVTETIEEAISTYGPPCALVNCAGITRDAPFEKMHVQDWVEVISTNLTSIFSVTQPIYRAMIACGQGTIVNISSVNGERGQFGQTNYSASKSGIHGFTMALAQEGARHGIRVNTVSPGYTETPMVAAVPAHAMERILKTIPLKRLATTDEIANAVSFLTSDQAAYVTGTNFSVNGGMRTGF